MIALVDYGAGNLTSVRKALRRCRGAVLDAGARRRSSTAATGVIVPGVGHFSATAALDDAWRAAILEAMERSVPLLGICVGLQWLFEGSTEAPAVPGLGVVRGCCRGWSRERQPIRQPGRRNRSRFRMWDGTR